MAQVSYVAVVKADLEVVQGDVSGLLERYHKEMQDAKGGNDVGDIPPFPDHPYWIAQHKLHALGMMINTGEVVMSAKEAEEVKEVTEGDKVKHEDTLAKIREDLGIVPDANNVPPVE